MKIDPRIVTALQANPALIGVVLETVQAALAADPNSYVSIVDVLSGKKTWQDALHDNPKVLLTVLQQLIPRLTPEVVTTLLSLLIAR